MTDKKLDRSQKYYYIGLRDDCKPVEVTIVDDWGTHYEAQMKNGTLLMVFPEELILQEIYDSGLYQAMEEDL